MSPRIAQAKGSDSCELPVLRPEGRSRASNRLQGTAVYPRVRLASGVIHIDGCRSGDVWSCSLRQLLRNLGLNTLWGGVEGSAGIEARRGEEGWMEATLQGLSVPCAGAIQAPGTLEGGDVILAGSVAFAGISRRSNEEGVRQLAALLARMGYETRAARLAPRYQHIGGPMSLIAPDRVVACRAEFPCGYFDGLEVIDVEPVGRSCGNVICLRANEVIANGAENQKTIETLQRCGVPQGSRRTDLSGSARAARIESLGLGADLTRVGVRRRARALSPPTG